MKRSFLFSLLITLFCFSGWGKEVTEQQAKEYAQTFLQSRTSCKISVREVKAMGSPRPDMYIINFAPQGWVLLTADDVVKPIVGYSFSGNLNEAILSPEFKYMIAEYSEEIQQAKKLDTERDIRWNAPSFITTRASSHVIDPLIKVNRNQPSPFNAYCPQQKALVGCVAVAMSQAMSVQRYPDRPLGSISYRSANYGNLSIDFGKEQAYNWNDIINGTDNYNETARLLYHAGMSVRMDYGEDGSGIPSNEVSRISDALKNYFSYPNTVRYVWRDYYEEDWSQLILNELNAGRAVIYNAVDTKEKAGHSFNVDGYDGEALFHINWGWGGYGNGNFSLNSLRDSRMQMNYDANHVIIIGIGAPTQQIRDISLSTNHIEEGLATGAIVGAIYVNGELLSSQYSTTVQGVNGNAVPFIIENGMLKTTNVLKATTNQWNIEITVKDSKTGASLTQGFRIYVDPWQSLGKTTSLSFDRKTRVFRLTTKHNVKYSITNEQGITLASGSLEPLPELTINSSTFAEGKVKVTLTCGNETKTIQLITK